MKLLIFIECLLLWPTVTADDGSDEFLANEGQVINGDYQGDHVDHGDIMFRKGEEEAVFGAGAHDNPLTDVMKDAIRNEAKRWKLPVPYVIESSLASTGRKAVMDAIEEYKRKTCITFRPRRISDRDYISIQQGSGCWSYVGRSGGKQSLSLGKGCHYRKTAVHELMHALGFWHEQSRPDRDGYVRINVANVKPAMLHNFNKKKASEVTDFGHPYDYRSVMHYSKKAFTANGRDTITVIGNPNQQLGQPFIGGGLSLIDAKQLNAMYCGATPRPPTRSTTTRPTVTRRRVPISRRRVPISRRRVPISRRRIPISRRRVPISRRRVPISRRRVPISRRRIPISRRRVPISRRRIPISRRRVPISRRRIPISRRRVPISRRRVPISRRRVPISRRRIPISRRRVPISRRRIPISRRRVPISRRRIPIYRRRVPISRRRIPISRRRVPISRRRIPISRRRSIRRRRIGRDTTVADTTSVKEKVDMLKGDEETQKVPNDKQKLIEIKSEKKEIDNSFPDTKVNENVVNGDKDVDNDLSDSDEGNEENLDDSDEEIDENLDGSDEEIDENSEDMEEDIEEHLDDTDEENDEDFDDIEKEVDENSGDPDEDTDETLDDTDEEVDKNSDDPEEENYEDVDDTDEEVDENSDDPDVDNHETLDDTVEDVEKNAEEEDGEKDKEINHNTIPGGTETDEKLDNGKNKVNEKKKDDSSAGKNDLLNNI